MIKRFAILLVFCVAIFIFLLPRPATAGIGYPLINNVTSVQLGSPPQVWGIIQDTHGVFYFAANSGLVKYDGENWILYQTKLKTSVRSLAIDQSGNIYCGATHEFGFFKPNNFGKYVFTSLSDSIENKNFESVYKTFIVGHAAYFMADHKRIFVYDSFGLKEINTEHFNEFRAFKLNEEIYMFSQKNGVAKIKDDKILIIDEDENPGKVYFALAYNNNKILAGTLNRGLFLYDLEKKSWEKFENEINAELIEGNAYFATRLHNQNIAIATLKQGVFIISADGKLVYQINKQTGLANNSTFYLYEDKYNDLWVGQEKGCSHIELSTPFTTLGSISGIDGSLQEFCTYNNNLFCGTSSGIFVKPITNISNAPQQSFRNLNPGHIYSLDFKKVKIPGYNEEILLASCLRNIVWITPNIDLKELYEIYACYAIAQSTKYPERIFLGNPKGIDVLDLKYINNAIAIKKVTKLPRIKESIRNLIFTPEGDLWIRSAFNNIYKIEFDDNESLSNFKLYSYNQLNEKYPDIVYTNLNIIDNKIIVTSNYGVFYTYIESDALIEKQFISDNSFGTNFKTDSLIIQDITKDNYGNFWYATQKGIFKFNPVSGASIQSQYQRLNDTKIQSLKSIENYGICLLSEDNLFFIENSESKIADFNFDVIMCKTEIGSNYATFWSDGLTGSSFELKEIIPETENSISFNFCAPFYQKTNLIKYTTKLKGFDKYWSSYNSKNSRTYTNLPSGKYTFYAKAQNLYGVESNEASFTFTVATPWYVKTIAIVTYVILGLLLIWLIVFLYYRKLRNEKHELQEIIREALSKEEEQSEQIRMQSIKLQEANVELEKLSLVASKTDNAIVIMDPHGEIEWINEGYKRLYGFSFHDLLLNGTKIIGDNANISINEMVNVWYGKREPIIYENLKHTKYGKSIWAQTTLTPVLNDNNELIHLIAM